MTPRARTLRLGRHTLRLGERTLVMGVLNVTPDSFSDGGLYLDPGRAAERARQMVEEGADVIDVGAESTRPGSEPVSAQDEWARLSPVLPRLSALPVPVSVDTRRADVADRALSAGASVVNDVSGLRFDPLLAETAARHSAALIVMHSRGNPRTMQDAPAYDDVMGEVTEELSAAVAAAERAGVAPDRILVDPGLGFGKTLEHNLLILRELPRLRALARPVVVGPSRKSFLTRILALPPDDLVEGTAAAVAACALAGVDIVRVHDVRAMARVREVCDAIAGRGLPLARAKGA